jgi:hypothetical protein
VCLDIRAVFLFVCFFVFFFFFLFLSCFVRLEGLFLYVLFIFCVCVCVLVCSFYFKCVWGMGRARVFSTKWPHFVCVSLFLPPLLKVKKIFSGVKIETSPNYACTSGRNRIPLNASASQGCLHFLIFLFLIFNPLLSPF